MLWKTTWWKKVEGLVCCFLHGYLMLLPKKLVCYARREQTRNLSMPILVNLDVTLAKRKEICFIVGTGNSNDVFLIVTDWNYPQSKPRIRVTDFGGVDLTQYIADVFAALYDKSQPAKEPTDFKWDPEASYIVDYLAVIEKEMGIRPVGPMPWERDGGTVSIAVNIDDEESGEHQTSKDGKSAQANANSVDEKKSGKENKQAEPVVKADSDKDIETEEGEETTS